MDDSQNALGAFLRARRRLVDPTDHGIRDGGRRRVAGLRREEIAFLAGVSAPYYARLEQGRDRSPSPAVVDAIASVLRLDAEAVQHLHRLASPPASPSRRRPRSRSPERVSPAVERLIASWHGQAAFVVGWHRDVLGANDLAAALTPGFAPGGNLVRDLFVGESARALYVDWEEVALGAVAGLRASAGSGSGDSRLDGLVDDPLSRSFEFRDMWARHDVQSKTSGVKCFRHPVVGRLDLDYQTFAVNGSDGQTLHVFSAAPGTPSADAFAALAGRLTPGAP